jgi:hypothetical protein
VEQLHGCSILAAGGQIGKVDEFYFDDDDWSICYLVVDIGKWLLGQRVLVSPAALGQPNWAADILPVTLTQEQVKNSPDISQDKPVSRQPKIDYWPGLDIPASPGVETSRMTQERGGRLFKPFTEAGTVVPSSTSSYSISGPTWQRSSRGKASSSSLRPTPSYRLSGISADRENDRTQPARQMTSETQATGCLKGYGGHRWMSQGPALESLA